MPKDDKQYMVTCPVCGIRDSVENYTAEQRATRIFEYSHGSWDVANTVDDGGLRVFHEHECEMSVGSFDSAVEMTGAWEDE